MVRPLPLLAVTLMLAGCGGGPTTNGSWAGDVVPRAAGPACAKTRGLAQVQGDRVTFSPNEGTWVLVGTLEANGQVTADKIGTGASKQAFETRLEARLTPSGMTGTYTTPRCVFDVTLRRL